MAVHEDRAPLDATEPRLLEEKSKDDNLMAVAAAESRQASLTSVTFSALANNKCEFSKDTSSSCFLHTDCLDNHSGKTIGWSNEVAISQRGCDE